MTTIELTDSNFESTIKDNDIVLVDFWAGIAAIPTLMAFRDGVLVFNQAGALPATALAEVVDTVKKLDMDQVRKELVAQSDGPAQGS